MRCRYRVPSVNLKMGSIMSKNSSKAFTIGLIFLLISSARAQEAEHPVDSSASTKEWFFSGGIGLYGNAVLSLPLMSTDGPPLKENVGSSDRFTAEAMYSGQYSWGFNFGLSLDSAKKVENSSDSNPDFQAVGGNSVLDVKTLYANAVYRWQNLYLPFGINLSRVSIRNPSAALASTNSFPGMQVGLGYLLGKHFALETGIRFVGLQAAYEAPNGGSSADRSGFLIEQFVTAKILF